LLRLLVPPLLLRATFFVTAAAFRQVGRVRLRQPLREFRFPRSVFSVAGEVRVFEWVGGFVVEFFPAVGLADVAQQRRNIVPFEMPGLRQSGERAQEDEEGTEFHGREWRVPNILIGHAQASRLSRIRCVRSGESRG
jgi:hypothetical protein